MTDPTPTNEPSFREPDPAQRPARLAFYLGIALIVVGAVAMYLGYNGAATNPIPQAQTPYVISGGMLGLGLMALGGIALGVYVLLRVQADFRTELDQMRMSFQELAEAMSHQMFGTGTSTNGHKVVMVTRGASSFHRAECRLVQGADHIRSLPEEEAVRTGLSPCRICKP